MKSNTIYALAVASLLAVTAAHVAADANSEPTPETTTPTLEIGAPAPPFEAIDTQGNTVTLADFEERILVIEWVHPGCDVSVHQHTTGPMRYAHNLFAADEVAFLTVNSLPTGHEFAGAEASIKAKRDLKIQVPLLVDEAGAIAAAYNATHAPTIVIIDAQGLVRYHGTIDNAPMGKAPVDQPRINHLEEALFAVIDEEPVEITTTPTDIGCPLSDDNDAQRHSDS